MTTIWPPLFNWTAPLTEPVIHVVFPLVIVPVPLIMLPAGHWAVTARVENIIMFITNNHRILAWVRIKGFMRIEGWVAPGNSPIPGQITKDCYLFSEYIYSLIFKFLYPLHLYHLLFLMNYSYQFNKNIYESVLISLYRNFFPKYGSSVLLRFTVEDRKFTKLPRKGKGIRYT